MRILPLLLVVGCWPALAGAQWQIQPSPTTADLRGVSAPSETVAWASGTNGTVLRTTDGGATWRPCAVPPEAGMLDLRGVQGFDANVALVMSSGQGELSRVYKTTDGCRSWEEVFRNPDPDGRWDSMQFQFRPGKPPGKGYYAFGVLIGHPVGGEFVIFTSKDYGSTWRSLHEDEAFSPGPSAWARPGESPAAYSNTALSPVADGNSFAFVTEGQSGARLLYPRGETYDFDHVALKYSFSELVLPLPSGTGAGAFSVAARRAAADRADLMVVGGDAEHPEAGSAVFIRHGGIDLKKLLAPRAVAAVRPPGGMRTAVAYEAASDSWITVGPNGTDVSHDDGRTWTSLSPTNLETADANKNWQSLALPFAVGPHGRIGKLRVVPAGPVLAGR